MFRLLHTETFWSTRRLFKNSGIITGEHLQPLQYTIKPTPHEHDVMVEDDVDYDDYVANLLKQDAKNTTKQYKLVGLDAFLPQKYVIGHCPIVNALSYLGEGACTGQPLANWRVCSNRCLGRDLAPQNRTQDS